MVHVEALNSERRASEVVSEVVALAYDRKVYSSITESEMSPPHLREERFASNT